ncbi:MAG: hypothetical protein IPK32_00355 [Verrucomicrobiaceae bacterium]|nr:hypothetical protein [Verrucomicrobiaceae bacterium]
MSHELDAGRLFSNFPGYGGRELSALEMRQGTGAPMAWSHDPREVGWGVIFGKSASTELSHAIRESLGQLRLAGASELWKKQHLYLRTPSPDESCESYLRSYRQEPGAPIDPDRFPYYVLIVADPADISFEFEMNLGMQNAVGRLWLGDELENYQPYLDEITQAGNGAGQSARTPIYLLESSDPDGAIQLGRKHLMSPLCTKLANITGAPESPVPSAPSDFPKNFSTHGMYFSLSHGMEVPFQTDEDKERQLERERLQGIPVDISQIQLNPSFDVAPSLPYSNKAWWAFACHSAGTTKFDPIEIAMGKSKQQADTDMSSKLERHCLGNANGSMRFFVGSLNRVTVMSYLTSDWTSYITHFVKMLDGLARGLPVGWVREHTLSGLWTSALLQLEYSRSRGNLGALKACFQQYHDFRSFVVRGDPAAFLG